MRDRVQTVLRLLGTLAAPLDTDALAPDPAALRGERLAAMEASASWRIGVP